MNGYLEHTQSWLKRTSGRTIIDPEMIGINLGKFKEKQTLMRAKSMMEKWSWE